jgi:hypothetical protein
VAKLTLASATPGTRARLFSTRRTQEAHVIPATGKLSVMQFDGACSILVVIAL